MCVGSAHWDILGEIPDAVRAGFDFPGSVVQRPGGVALGVARAINAFGERPLLWSAVGDDDDGKGLVAALEKDGLATEGVMMLNGRRTDRCMFIVDGDGSVTGVSDCRLLEFAGGRLVRRLAGIGDLRSGDDAVLIVDGNLSVETLAELSEGGPFEGVRMRFAVASDGKAERAKAFLGRRGTVIHLNRVEAGMIAQREFESSAAAASFLVKAGFERAVVSDLHSGVADCDRNGLVSVDPKRADRAVRVIGAGDRLMAAHLVAEIRGYSRHDALEFAANAARNFVAGGSKS